MERSYRNIELGKFISEYRHKKFEYGNYDCNIFTSEWVDRNCGTDITNTIRGQYNTVRQMLRFAKIKKIRKELEKAGYLQVNGDITTGDILIKRDKSGFYHSAIALHGYAYTMDVDKDLSKISVGHFAQDPEVEIWRIA